MARAVRSPSLMTDAPLLRFAQVSKRFGGTLAVDRVSLDLHAGEILALLGENGAGKSTLIKMLAGIHDPDEGEILVHGQHYQHRPAVAGERQTIAFIHQDLGLIEWMTVTENMAMGLGYPRSLGLINWRQAERRAREALAAIGGAIDPDARVGSLTRTEKSLVAIARALAVEAEIIVLDEPTASLPSDEVARLVAVLRRLCGHNVGMIYVSHRLDEVFEVADEVAVLRDGRLVGRKPVAETTPRELVTMIVGRPPEQVFVRAETAGRAVVLELRDLRIGAVGPISLTLRAGEMLGLVGLRGAGQEQIGRALFGLATSDAGTVTLCGGQPDLHGPGAAMRAGIGLVAGDRTGESLAMSLSVRENLFLNPAASGRRALDWQRPAIEQRQAKVLCGRFGVRPSDPARPAETLSGGNQQKVVIARWLEIAEKLLILEEPTAGVDVGAKAEIYGLLNAALERGLAILVIATDFEEVANICHRALVFSRGEVVDELNCDQLSVEAILHAASAGIEGSAERLAAHA
jgi:ribose transport system ATP-binding protein